MENYNTGHVVDFFEITDYVKAAKDFSEGNSELEQLLLNCFSKGIKTVASCKGHPETGQEPYIAFSYCFDNQQVIYAILSRLEDKGVSFRYNKVSNNSYFSFNFDEYNEVSTLFNEINTVINEFNKEKDYFLTLPRYLQEYVSIVKIAEIDESLRINKGDSFAVFQLGCEKIEDGYRYFMISNDLFYRRIAEKSGFQNYINDFFSTLIFDVSSKELGFECLNNFVVQLRSNLFRARPIAIEDIEISEDSQLQVDFGDTLNDVIQKLLFCKKNNQKVFAIFNGIRIDNYKNNVVEDIVEQYNLELSKKRRDNVFNDNKDVVVEEELDELINKIYSNFGVDLSKNSGRTR